MEFQFLPQREIERPSIGVFQPKYSRKMNALRLVLVIFYLLPAARTFSVPVRSFNNRCNKVSIPNGSMTLKHRGRVAKFTCNVGFRLIGDKIGTCHSRRWEAIPVCVKDVKCPEQLPKVLNGMMIVHQYIYFKVICNPGFKISDSLSVFPCELFYNPSMKTPICQLAEGNFCDFENGMCEWYNTDTTLSFPWILHQNETPSHSLHTGPSGDHTTGFGHYLYIEASGVLEEKFAKLTRPFSPIETPDVCFIFWYHMYGYTMGTLDVYIDYNKVFTKSGNLGDKWRMGIIRNLPSERRFQVSIVATSGTGYAGDIAIDDIGLINSTECTKIPLIEASCRSRCFEDERNTTLCKCSSECLIESTCCPDFVSLCSAESGTTDATTLTTVDTTTDWNYSTEMFSQATDYKSEAESRGTTETPNDLFQTVSSSENEPFQNIPTTMDSTEFSRMESRSDYQIGIIKITELMLHRPRLMSTLPVPNKVGILSTTFSSNSNATLTNTDRTDENISSTVIKMNAHPSLNTQLQTTEIPSNMTYNLSINSSRVEINRTTEEPITNVTSNEKPLPKALMQTSSRISSTSDDQPHFDTLQNEIKMADVTTPITASRTTQLLDTTPYLKTISIPLSTSTPPSAAASVENDATEFSVVSTHSGTHSINSDSVIRTSHPNVEDSSLLNHFDWSTESSDFSTERTVQLSRGLTHSLVVAVSHDDYYDVIDERVERLSTMSDVRLSMETVRSKESIAVKMDTSGPKGKGDVSSGEYKWKRTYVPKGRYTFSAVTYEFRTTTYISIICGSLVFLTAIVAIVYVFRRRRQLNRFHDNTDESDVLYLTSDDILDFNVATRNPGPSSEQLAQGSRRLLSNLDFSC